MPSLKRAAQIYYSVFHPVLKTKERTVEAQPYDLLLPTNSRSFPCLWNVILMFVICALFQT